MLYFWGKESSKAARMGSGGLLAGVHTDTEDPSARVPNSRVCSSLRVSDVGGADKRL